MLLVAGCGFVPQGDAVHISLYGPDTQNESDVALNPISVSGSNFQLEGELVTGGGATNRDLYEDVNILLYRENESLLCSYRVGDWNPTQPKRVSVSTNDVPGFVIIYSPDFWNEPMSVEYFVSDDEGTGFVPREATSKEELPVDVSTTRGPECTQT